jgi:ATP-dependent Lon protease
MKAIQKELGEMEDAPNELAELEQKIKAAGMPKEAKEKATSELGKLKLMSPMSAEATVVRNYIDWLVKVPWKKRTKVHQNLADAERVLEEDHYGLEKVKERILEYLAVQQRVKERRARSRLGGPPGVGKTSLGQSIARDQSRRPHVARRRARRGRDPRHRRTYIGSSRQDQKNRQGLRPQLLFLLDEVDKMSMDFRGDPSSALLEVLDPEQNSTFNDHYLEVDFDLSEVMFVCTANSLNSPPPLLDRMETIRLPGYTEDEKLNIARRYLIPKQMRQNGLQEAELKVSDSAIVDIIRYYTREAGVRNLEREAASICHKVVKVAAQAPQGNGARRSAISRNVGVRRFRYGRAEENDQIGQSRASRGRKSAASY